MLLGFVIIVFLEAFVISKKLKILSKKDSLKISFKANLLTILLVIPIVWVLWLAIALNLPPYFTDVISGKYIDNIIGAPWIGDSENLLLAEWVMAPVYFYASYKFEYLISRKKLQAVEDKLIRKTFFQANLYSYLLMMTFETIYQISISFYKEDMPYLW